MEHCYRYVSDIFLWKAKIRLNCLKIDIVLEMVSIINSSIIFVVVVVVTTTLVLK